MEARRTSSENDTPALVAAVRDENLSLVMRLVEQGHSLHDRDKDGATALYWACSRGHANISDFLLNAGSDVNARVKWGATPLLAAADNGQEICINQLIKSHADVNAANNRGDTPLHAAAYRGYANVLCRLMEAGANPFLKNSASMTALQEAFVQRNQECVQLLQQYMDVPGFSGPISLPTPSQESTSSYTDSLVEPYKTWPYVPTPSRPRSSQIEQQTPSSSLRSPKMDNLNKFTTNSLNYCDTTRPLSDYAHSDLPQPTTQSDWKQNTEPVDSIPSFQKIHHRSLADLSVSSTSELKAEGKSGILSFDSPLLNAVSVQSKSDCQVIHSSRNSQPSSLSHNFHQEVKSETARMESIHKLKQYESHTDIQNAPIIVPRSKTSKAPTLTNNDRSITRGVASNTRPLSDPIQASVPERRSGKTKYVSGKILPGVNVSEFVETLQFQVIELQEKVIQSSAIIAQLRDQVIDVQRENNELKKENLLLRNLLHQHDPAGSDLTTRGTWESRDGEKDSTVAPELLQSVARFIDRVGPGGHGASRQAIESSECDDSPS
ncbi:hypothetical protein BsWGS_00249 [Bradybaena similaris]